MSAPSGYIVNPGPKKPALGRRAAVTTDSAIVTEVIMKVLASGGNAVSYTHLTLPTICSV